MDFKFRNLFHFFSIFLGFILSLPNTAAVLRCVHVDNRSMAIGVHAIIARLVGGIPGPIMFGYFIDKTCMYLNITCGKILDRLKL